MTPFQHIPDSVVILYSRGVYTQSPLYRRDEKVYAKRGSGYVRLFARNGTSVPNVIWKEFDAGDLNVETKGPYMEIIIPDRSSRAKRAA